MNIDNIAQELEVIRGRLGRLLNDQGKRAIESAIASMETQRREAVKKSDRRHRQKRRERPPWRLVISPDLPLAFKEAQLKHRLQVDICCDMVEPRQGRPLGPHNVAVRIWSPDERFWYRADYDPDALRDRVRCGNQRRVMLRFHFDFANPNQSGPSFHMQVGGKQHAGEECWHPETLDVPRFVHHPVNLLLVCEFVAMTFFAPEYREIAQDPSWRGALATAQKEYVIPFFLNCRGFRNLTAATFNPEESLLSYLWNQ